VEPSLCKEELFAISHGGKLLLFQHRRQSRPVVRRHVTRWMVVEATMPEASFQILLLGVVSFKLCGPCLTAKQHLAVSLWVRPGVVCS
jgi:hypothetical protein